MDGCRLLLHRLRPPCQATVRSGDCRGSAPVAAPSSVSLMQGLHPLFECCGAFQCAFSHAHYCYILDEPSLLPARLSCGRMLSWEWRVRIRDILRTMAWRVANATKCKVCPLGAGWLLIGQEDAVSICRPLLIACILREVLSGRLPCSIAGAPHRDPLCLQPVLPAFYGVEVLQYFQGIAAAQPAARVYSNITPGLRTKCTTNFKGLLFTRQHTSH